MTPISRKPRACTSTNKSDPVTSNEGSRSTERRKSATIPSALPRAVDLHPNLPTTTFEHFQQLPAELQVRIIKYAWLSLNRDVDIECTYRTYYEPGTGRTNHPCPIAAAPRLPPLCLVNKLFLSECRFLARAHLTPISNDKVVPFLLNLDVLNLDVVLSLIHERDISTWFNALPAELRHKVKHVRLKMSNQNDVRALWYSERNSQEVTRVIGRLDAPLLETFAVVGMHWEKLFLFKFLGGVMEFEVERRGGRVVKVDWRA
jgi:hypothetical protein